MADEPAPALDPRSRIWGLAAALACATPLLLLVPHWFAGALLLICAAITAISWKRPASIVLRLFLTLSAVALVLYTYNYKIGRDSASALLLAMLMLKPAELRTSRDVRSLIGFGLFAMFSALLLDQGPLTMMLAIPAGMLAFGACARLADAEVGTLGSTMNRRRVLAILALFALATPLALAGFWLFPRLGSPLWGLPDVAKAKIGVGDNMAPGDWLNVLTDSTPAFRVRFAGPTPPQQLLYWRGIVMWDFDGRTWTQAPWPKSMKPAAVVPSGQPVRYDVSLEPTDKHYLFALDLPQDAPVDALMAEDFSLTSTQPISSLLAYSVTSAVPARFEENLDPRIRQVALRLPFGFNPRAIALAQQWRSESSSDVEIVQRALAMYRKDFSYSLAAPPLGRDSVDEFLFNTRLGFCEHFSSSFTFLMRAAGIPARVVTGYVGGYRNRIGGFTLVRQSDAHAWSEVWLRGRGWTRVDPTAAVAPDRVFREAVRDNTASAAGGTTLGQLFDVGDWLRNDWNDLVLRFDAERQQLLLASIGLKNSDKNTLAIVFGVTTGLLLFGIGLWQLRDRGPRKEALLIAWNRFTNRLARAHLRKQPHEPATTWARRIAPLLPAQREQIVTLCERFSSARYAGTDMDDQTRLALIRDLRAFRVDNAAQA